MEQLTPLTSVIITGITTLIVGFLTFLGVVYQSNKNFDKQQAQSDTQRQLLETKFDDYKEFLHQVNKDIKKDIETLSVRVDEHNNYGIKIPVIEKEIEGLKRRLCNLEEK